MSGRKIQRTADWAFWDSAEVAALDLAEFKTLFVCAKKADQSEYAMKSGAAKSTIFRLRRKDVSERIHPRRWGTGPDSILSTLASKGFIRIISSKRRVGYYIQWRDDKTVSAIVEPKRDDFDIPCGIQTEVGVPSGSSTSQNGEAEKPVDLPQGMSLTFHRECPLRSGKDQEEILLLDLPQGSQTETPTSPSQNGTHAETTQIVQEATRAAAEQAAERELARAEKYWNNAFHRTLDDGTETGFWSRYPRHRRKNSDKPKALAEWRMLRPEPPTRHNLEAEAKSLMRALTGWLDSEGWQAKDGRYVPNIVKFLAEKRFLDDPADQSVFNDSDPY